MNPRLFALSIACVCVFNQQAWSIDPAPEALSRLVENLKRVEDSSGGKDAIGVLLNRETEAVETELRTLDDELRKMAQTIQELEKRQAALQARLARAAQNEPASKGEIFWSFLPLSAPPVPAVDSDWVRNPIDSFILNKHEELGLSHSDEADRRTLIRRLTYNLHGLPPTPEEVAEFLADDSPDAYERLVDRLLASPRYGERWGRHWLDVVHYADTHGYDKDKRRPHAWPYRDYVIRSLNEDKPYARFVKEQIAGDVLYPDDPMGVVASGFIAAGPWDFVGHVELREGTKDKNITRVLDRDDMVMNSMSTFLSLTVHCARCHDHKFDPIDQEDYYSLQAVFAGVDRANRPYHPDPEVFRTWRNLQSSLARLEDDERVHTQWIAEVTGPALASIDRQVVSAQTEIEARETEKSPSNGYHSAVASASNEEKWVQIDLGEASPIDQIVLFPARPVDFPDTPGFGFPRRFRIEGATEETFSSPVLLVDRSSEDYSNPGDVPVEFPLPPADVRYIRMTAVRLWERSNDFVFALAEARVFSGSEILSNGKAVQALDSIESGLWSTGHLVDGFDSRQRIDGEEGDSIEEIKEELANLTSLREKTAISLLTATSAETVLTTRKKLDTVREELKGLPEPKWVYAAANDFKPEGAFRPAGKPRPIHILPRGEVTRLGREVAPAGLKALNHKPAAFQLSNPDDEGERRAALAEWIVHLDNPLFWRSIVNRVWHYHFGKGLVDTPNDFGRMGSKPTHPELLDWLACTFQDSGGSLKQLHRLILTSSTYRQSSNHREEEALRDAGNRYYWRMDRTRLDAESLRDSVLAVSGKLDLTMGGPGFDLFGFIDDHSPHYLYRDHDVDDPASLRRTVYRFIVRSVPDPFMECLDCADPSQNVPVRNLTLTPLQSLALLNNPFMVRQSEHFAARVEAEASDLSARIDRAYQLALSRGPDDQERGMLMEYASMHGLAAACRILLNSNEFSFVD